MTLKDLCNEVLELDKKATKGPWFQCMATIVGDTDIFVADLVSEQLETIPEHINSNGQLIAHYRTACVKFAKMALRMEEALHKNIATGSLTFKCPGQMENIIGTMQRQNALALADVQKIVEGE